MLEKKVQLHYFLVMPKQIWGPFGGFISYLSRHPLKECQEHKYKHEVNIFEAKQRKITCIWLILINDKWLPGLCRWIWVRWSVEKIWSWFLGAFGGLNLVLFSFLATFWCLVWLDVWLIDCQRHLIIAILTSINLSQIWHIETSFLRQLLRQLNMLISIAWKTCWEKRNTFKIGQ